MGRLGTRVGSVTALLLLVQLTLGAPATAELVPDRFDPNAGLLRWAESARSAGVHAPNAGPITDNFEIVGHSDLGGDGFNADVWVHGNFAYVGVWGSGDICPATGVKVVDISDPAAPNVVSVLANPEGTSAEDVVVRSVDTPSFTGDLAVVGIQHPCGSRRQGLRFFDVTDPTRPVRLSDWKSPARAPGCHEVDLVQRDDGTVLAGCANLFAELIVGKDEVVLVDATDPTNPQKVGGWALQADLGHDPAKGVGCDQIAFAHSVRFADGGQTVYASYWDAGTINLDISNPAAPEFVGTTKLQPLDEDGDNHSMTTAEGGKLIMINPEDFSPVVCGSRWGGWGEVWIYNNENPSNTRFLASFSTPNSASGRTDGFYTVHNTEVSGQDAYSSWYSDGIVWWRFKAVPAMKGQFVPPPTPDPHGVFPTVPIVWGVAIDQGTGLILGSDINSGLWIVRPL
jgi:hypothetical protein